MATQVAAVQRARKNAMFHGTAEYQASQSSHAIVEIVP
jgi:hypothetical protein